jgi:preprotein translocase subunit SecG
MVWVIVPLHILLTIMLIILVLMHSGRGGGLSDMLGGSGAAALGSTSAERNLNRITFVVALAFGFTTLSLGFLLGG